jgi:hypothetical protein
MGELRIGQHDRRPLRGDGQLLGGDLRPRSAEHVRVLEADVRQQHDPGIEHVRRVVATAEPGLDRGCFQAALREIGEGCRRQDLELRRTDGFSVGSDARDRALETRLVRVEALMPAGHVRRRVRGTADRPRDAPRRRRLAFRADDVHGLKGALRMVKAVDELVHPLEPEALRRPRRQRRQPVSRRLVSR